MKMFKSMPYNTASSSFMNESTCAASASSLRLNMDTVLAVSIFVILGLVISIIAHIELSVVILAIVSVVIISLLLAVLIIKSPCTNRPNVVKAY